MELYTLHAALSFLLKRWKDWQNPINPSNSQFDPSSASGICCTTDWLKVKTEARLM